MEIAVENGEATLLRIHYVADTQDRRTAPQRRLRSASSESIFQDIKIRFCEVLFFSGTFSPPFIFLSYFFLINLKKLDYSNLESMRKLISFSIFQTPQPSVTSPSLLPFYYLSILSFLLSETGDKTDFTRAFL